MLPLSDPTPALPGPVKAPWERLSGESEEDYGYFLTFLARRTTLKTLSEITNLSSAALGKIATRHRWRARRSAYYLEQENELREEIQADAKRQAAALIQTWGELLEWSLESILHARAEGRRLDPKEAMQALKNGTEAIRLIGGQSTANLSVDLSGASDEDLQKAREAWLKVTKGG